MAAPRQFDSEATHRFAWHGFSFLVPRDWNLSAYSIRRKVSSVRMEDDNTVRLEMEWTRSRRPFDMERIRKRFDAVSKSLTLAGAATHPVDDLPKIWSACLYSMPDGRRLLVAFRFVPDSGFFCFFKLHFESASLREPPRVIQLIATTFQLHEQDVVPWELYDIEFQLNREFRLLSTSFQAGRQQMVFEWRRRRLHLWFFSLGDLILKGKPMEAWCADFLDGFKGIQGPKFSAGEQHGVLHARRSRKYPLGHGEEIGRWCFRYQARCLNLAVKNQIVLWVFQFRKDSDLDHLMLKLGPLTISPEHPL